MIAECTTCGDPLFPHVERCAGCGAANPAFAAAADPPEKHVYTTDQGTEWGLLGLGVLGPVVGANALFHLHDPGAAWLPRAAGASAVLGIAFLVVYHRLDVADLGSSSKTALRVAMGGAAVLYAWLHSFR